MALWIKTNSAGDMFMSANGNAGGFTQGLGLAIPSGWACSSGQLYFNMANGTTRDTALCSSASVRDGKWHHVVVVISRTAGVKSFYIDGKFDNSNSITISGSVTNPKLFLGKTNWDNWFNGSMDDVRIYNRALSATEVAQLYSLGK